MARSVFAFGMVVLACACGGGEAPEQAASQSGGAGGVNPIGASGWGNGGGGTGGAAGAAGGAGKTGGSGGRTTASGTCKDAIDPAVAPGATHAYFQSLLSRPDCFAGYGLRDAAQVDGLRTPSDGPSNIVYVYPTDPDPRRQEATKIIVPEGSMGPGVELQMPAGPSAGKNVLITFDYWWGNEFNRNHSKLDLHKECPVTISSGAGALVAMRTDYSAAREFEHNQPPGGPYVAMTYVQAIGKGSILKTPSWWMDGMPGYPRLTLPYDAPSTERRTYVEGLAPVDSSVDASGAEMGIVGERWMRFWHFFERAPAEDWSSEYAGSLGKPMSAYRYSVWFADSVREPFRVIDQAVIGIPADHPSGITSADLHMGAGNSNLPSAYPGRGDLIAYSRNWVVLHGTPHADVLTLLQKP